MAEIKTTDRSSELEKFKKYRNDKRKKRDQSIREKIKKAGLSEKNVSDFFDQIYDYKGLIKKKYLSYLSTSLDMEVQKKALEKECEKIEEDAGNYIQEALDRTLYVNKLRQLHSKNLINNEDFTELEKDLEEPPLTKELKQKIDSLAKADVYVDSILKLILRKAPHIKTYLPDIRSFISKNKNEFKKVFKNSLEFNNKANLSELKNAKNISTVENELEKLVR